MTFDGNVLTNASNVEVLYQAEPGSLLFSVRTVTSSSDPSIQLHKCLDSL